MAVLAPSAQQPGFERSGTEADVDGDVRDGLGGRVPEGVGGGGVVRCAWCEEVFSNQCSVFSLQPHANAY